MSVFKYIFDSDWSQRSDIEALKEQNDSLAERLRQRRSKEAATEAQIEELQQEVGELALICKTLMQVLLEKRICTGQEIEALVEKIDAADGVVDGQVTKAKPPELKECPKCQRPVQHQHTHCVYCGHEYPL
jgi:DNA repair exonuclease SbcCD ATPase subunit